MSQNLVQKRADSAISTAFTDDPDSFIIGDRVWVQGIKPGYIVYIGEVRFARGDWAGVVLDKDEGKNDGSVYGVRYFQCQPNHGLFTRLHRLTRYPIDVVDPNNNPITTTKTITESGTATSIQTKRMCTSDGKVTTTVTRVTKTPGNIPHYALPTKPTKVITTVTTTTTTFEKPTIRQQPKSVLKSSCRVTSSKPAGSRPHSSNHHVHF